jgi:hypothetical protein
VDLRDQIKPKLDAWSKGKQDNIRALLSTLHTVLWADSGWKTPGLTDLVEASKVPMHLAVAVDQPCVLSHHSAPVSVFTAMHHSDFTVVSVQCQCSHVFNAATVKGLGCCSLQVAVLPTMVRHLAAQRHTPLPHQPQLPAPCACAGEAVLHEGEPAGAPGQGQPEGRQPGAGRHRRHRL